jgi:acyl-CoA thioester hydrolase
MLGHVNNAVFAEFCEAGRVELLDAAGGARSAEHAVVVVRVVVNFLQELHYPGSISIGSAVTAVGNTSFTIVQGFFQRETCVGTTEAVCVTIDPATRRARPVPAALRARLTTVAPPRATQV